MPSDKDKNRIIPVILVGIITAACIVLALITGKQAGDEFRHELQERAQTIASALGDHEVSQLSGSSLDEEKEAYVTLKRQLAAVKKANQDVRSIYLAGENDGRVFFFVDSEQPGSRDYSPAAEWYDDATPAFKGVFTKNAATVEGPVSDNFGTFISGLAPVDSTDAQGKHPVALLGIDVDADRYWRDIIIAMAIPLTTGLSLVLIIIIFEWIRRRNLQLLDLRSELVSVASHELRTPIIGIKWGAESLETIVTDQKALPYIKAIRNSALSLQASADDILELTHAINNRKVVLKPTNVTKLVRDVFDTQQLTAEQKNVELALDESMDDDLTIMLDADKMRRVLHNMISNAIKYTQEGTAVTVSYQHDEKMHRLLVRDQGIGIPPTEQDKVLKGFYRASNAIASKVQGTGLGLYLVKTVLEQHGGKVSFISEEDKGTTFILSIPKRPLR
jgi:signal transduction histidine kinase